MKFNIIHINCDCSSDTIARVPREYIYGPRCPNCNTVLGPMQWSIICQVNSKNSRFALQDYKDR